MKDIPVFTTQYGAASLILSQIPYREEGYIRVQSSLEPKLLLEECARFLRACGAERIYATGKDLPQDLPVYTELVQMQIAKAALPETEAALWPVLPENLNQWADIYNQKTARIPMGAWMTDQQRKELLASGEGYFVHKNGKLLGIGRVSGDTIQFVASVSPGAGADVVAALAGTASEPILRLTVASTNEKALRLYEKLGFFKTCQISTWYCIR
ncbi:MAG: hypothetical protein IJB91_06695 [Oscillospiraceae bacterium]|nr:hypothetical protein [Oscillospiraceae bacterium]